MRLASVIDDAAEVRRAISLIELGARLQVLESETRLSHERLLKLYKEIAGSRRPRACCLSRPTGSSPGSRTSTRRCSCIYNYSDQVRARPGSTPTRSSRRYELYSEAMRAVMRARAALSITRAWRLVRFIDAGMLRRAECTQVAAATSSCDYSLHQIQEHYVSAASALPPRAGRTKDPQGGRASTEPTRPSRGRPPRAASADLCVGRCSLNAHGLARQAAQAPRGPAGGRGAAYLQGLANAMLVIVGYLIVLVSVFGGFALAGGHLAALLQPVELLMIGGAALGAFVVGNHRQGDQGHAEGAAVVASRARQVHQGAVHGADGAAVRHPAEGAQGRPDVDRGRRRGRRSRARAVREVPDGAGRPPRGRVHHRLPAPDGRPAT